MNVITGCIALLSTLVSSDPSCSNLTYWIATCMLDVPAAKAWSYSFACLWSGVCQCNIWMDYVSVPVPLKPTVLLCTCTFIVRAVCMCTYKLTHTHMYIRTYPHTHACTHRRTEGREWNSREKGGELRNPMLLLLGSVACCASPLSLWAYHCSAHP